MPEIGYLIMIRDNLTAKSFFNVFREISEIQFLARNLSVKLKHVLGFAFEVRSSIETVRNENSVIVISLLGLVSFRYFSEFVLNLANNVEGNFDLLLGLVGLHCCADDGNVSILLGNAVDIRDHHDVDIYITQIVPFFLFSCF